MKVGLSSAQMALCALGVINRTVRPKALSGVAMNKLDTSIVDICVAKPIIVKNKYTDFISNIANKFLNK